MMSDREVDTFDLDEFGLLKVDFGASLAECRAAYIASAKRWHPDRSDDPQAHNQFHQLSLAYAAARKRMATARAASSVDERLPHVVRCSHCHQECLTPRLAEYVGIISLVLWCWRWRVRGIFCQSCAKRAAWKTSAVSIFLGWWSLPGIVVTLPAVVRNMSGGRQNKAMNLDLACHNLVALKAAGDLETARLLGQLISAQGASLPVSVVATITALASTRKNGDFGYFPPPETPRSSLGKA
jgi:hypothetical protein